MGIFVPWMKRDAKFITILKKTKFYVGPHPLNVKPAAHMRNPKRLSLLRHNTGNQL